jgi:hypothetical protein
MRGMGRRVMNLGRVSTMHLSAERRSTPQSFAVTGRAKKGHERLSRAPVQLQLRVCMLSRYVCPHDDDMFSPIKFDRQYPILPNGRRYMK